MAGHFAQQLYGGPPEKWESSLDAEGLAQAASDAAAAWDDEAYDHAAWFFGTAPAWRGYALGYALVGRHLAARPNETPAKLIHAEAASFRDNLKSTFG
ncbi:DUF2268 domain-containing putative Zn-dependent protease [Rhodovulum sulfidophilum]|uniref:DUF2268 domain-containing putative Zn-dependent protease n=1 Tax=Rhodovulum sulfidophilum TaxID=35806 RepID=UPI0019135F86